MGPWNHTVYFQVAVIEPHAALCPPAKERFNKAELNAHQGGLMWTAKEVDPHVNSTTSSPNTIGMCMEEQ